MYHLNTAANWSYHRLSLFALDYVHLAGTVTGKKIRASVAFLLLDLALVISLCCRKYGALEAKQFFNHSILLELELISTAGH